MNVPGIPNALSTLAAANGSKAPSANATRAQPASSFRQALSHEVAQRQPAPRPAAKPQEAAKPQPGVKAESADKLRQAEATPDDEAAAPPDAAPAAAEAQPLDAKPEARTAAEDSMASLADIPGAPQAALMMQLMHPAPATPAAVATDAAAIASGKAVSREAAGQRAPDLLESVAAGKEGAAGAAPPAPADAAQTDLHAAFGKSVSDAASRQAAQLESAAQAEAPATAPAALAALQSSIQATQAPAGHVDKLTPPVGTPAWDQALGQKIVWMSRGGEQSATLTMNPPDLGPMQVVLSVSNNQATVDFMAAQPEVREALEAALPRLREMMNESGVQLGQANVSAGSQQQFAGFDGQNKGAARGNDGLANDDTAPQPRQGVVRMARDGVVDTFA